MVKAHKRSRPTVTKGPASQYEQPSQTIREFSDSKGHGGLLALYEMEDRLIVDLYRLDPEVVVHVNGKLVRGFRE